MLVLSRRENEKLLIPCIGTAVQVLSVQGGQVRLGIEAPAEIAVFREEIYKDDGERGPQGGRAPAALPPRLRAALRHRLAGVAGGLDRLHQEATADLSPAGRDALDQLGLAFDELVGVVNRLLESDNVSGAKRPAGCAR